MIDEHLRVAVEFDSAEDPIAGRVSTDTDEQPFTGWLSLISGLEAVVTGWREQTGKSELGVGREDS